MEHLGVAADGGERRAQFVRRVGEKASQPLPAGRSLGEGELDALEHAVERQAEAPDLGPAVGRRDALGEVAGRDAAGAAAIPSRGRNSRRTSHQARAPRTTSTTRVTRTSPSTRRPSVCCTSASGTATISAPETGWVLHQDAVPVVAADGGRRERHILRGVVWRREGRREIRYGLYRAAVLEGDGVEHDTSTVTQLAPRPGRHGREGAATLALKGAFAAGQGEGDGRTRVEQLLVDAVHEEGAQREVGRGVGDQQAGGDEPDQREQQAEAESHGSPVGRRRL